MTSSATPGGNRAPALFASVAIVLIALTGVAALSFHPQGTSPSTFTGVGSATTKAANGLLLGLSLNQTTIESGQTVGITVYERNTLAMVNNVSASDKWPVSGLSIGPCGPLNLPIGIVVYSGNVSILAVPGADTLALYAPGTYSCPMILSGISAYLFQPSSTEAQVIGSCTPNPCFTSNVSSTIDAKGYWGTTFLQSSFSNFAPGIYTVLAGDEWGDVAILQFSVSSSLQATSSSETCAPAATLTRTSGGTTTTQAITLCHSVSSYTAASNSTQSGQGGVALSSIVMISPYTPAGPTLALTLRNLMGCCVTNLTATLVLDSNYTFHFTGVSSSHPLDNEQYASSVETLIGGFDSAKNYALVIKGTTQDMVFTYNVQTRIPPNYSHLIYLSASCAGNGGTAPCWDGDPFVFECTNLLAGPSTQWTCTEKVTSTIEPSQSYNITVTLPVTGQNGEQGWDNCEWSVPGASPGQGYAYCIPVSSSGGSVSFILADQAPPPP